MNTKLLLSVGLATFALVSSDSFAQESYGSKVEQAKQMSTMSGRPLLAVLGEARNWPPCLAVMKRLNSSEALAEYTSQFVTVRMSSKDKAWKGFHADFKGEHEGKVKFPFVYIVRSDGTSMFAGSGMMEVPEMGKILHAALKKNGRMFSKKEMIQLVKTKEQIEGYLKEDDIKSAVNALRKVAKLGPPGEIASFAKPAMELNQTVNEMIAAGSDLLMPIKDKLEPGTLESEADKLDLLSKYLEVSDSYSALRPLRTDFSEIKKLIQETDGLRELQKSLEIVLKSDSAKSKNAITRALEKLEQIVAERKTGALVDQAKEKISELNQKLSEIQ